MKSNELKSTDLMVGDWLKHYNGTPMQVTKITTEHFACAENKGMNCWEYNNKYEPIPLTPEILKKNGFGYDRNEGYSILKLEDNSELLYYFHEYKLTRFYKSEIIFRYQCVYVHELQHALKLCGIDKEIVV